MNFDNCYLKFFIDNNVKAIATHTPVQLKYGGIRELHALNSEILHDILST